MKLQLGYSPCPNDTFIFDALVNGGIDTGPFEFEPVLEDVQTLNEWAIKGRLDITKISYGVLPLISHRYHLLESGGALGMGVGPLLIAKRQTDPEEIDQSIIAIPGENTTANLLFSLAFPKALQKKYMLFSDIEGAVLDGKVQAGVIIHENRFTYQQKGLVKIMDLGKNWEEKTGAPIPLGGIVLKKEFDQLIGIRINALIKKSIAVSYANYPILSGYVKQHAREMSEKVMKQHIDLYVNHYSLSLGEEGRKAIDILMNTYNTASKDEISIIG